MRTNYIKYQNLILYLCQKLGGSIHGRKKLFKLLYYVDFDMFEYKESRMTVTGTKYYAWKMGPVPEKEVFEKIISDMQQDGSITDAKEDTAPGYHPTEVITAKKDPNYSVFNDDEIFIINKDNLKIDGNKFYEAFFDNYSIGDVIELQKGESVNDEDKLSIATFDTLNKLINDIVEKIEEQKED